MSWAGQVGDRGSGDELNELAVTCNRPSGREIEHKAATTLDWCVVIGKADVIALCFVTAFGLSDTVTVGEGVLSPTHTHTHTHSHMHTLRQGVIYREYII